MSDQLTNDLESLRISRDERPAGGGLKVVVILGALAAIAAVGYFLVLPRVQSALFKTEVEITEIGSVSPSGGAVDLTSTGYVLPQTISQVGAKISGRVAEVAVREGTEVQAGALLVRIDDSDLRAQVAASRSQVLAARARAQNAKANLVEIEQQARRERALVEKGVAAVAGAEDLEARFKALQEAARAADAEVRAAQSQVDSLETNQKELTVLAPISGRVISKPPELGEVASPAKPLLTLADFRTLAVETDVPEGRLHLVKVGMPTEVSLDAFPSRRLRGEVLEISSRVDRAKATVNVKVKFVDPTDGVLPDMAARVSFLQNAIDEKTLKEPPKTVVPQAAVVDRAGAKVVFTVEDGQARMVPVTLGPAFGPGFELKSGPAPGTKVIKNPAATLADGQKIKEKSAQ